MLNGTYFNVGQNTDCGPKSSGHGCSNCDTSNIVQQSWFKNMFGNIRTSQFVSAGRSCVGFAWFAEWYIFRESDSDTVARFQVGTFSFDQSNVSAHAIPGDYVYVNGHAAVYLGFNASGIQVLDCNWSGNHNCMVSKHTIYYSYSKDITIVRSYSVSAGRPSCSSHVKGAYLWPESLHPHYNYFTCSVCGATFTDGSTTKLDSCSQCQHTHTQGTYRGYQAEHPHHSCFSCAECGEIFPDNSTSNFSPSCPICHPVHVWDTGYISREPTFTSYGERTCACAICGGTRTESVPMLDSVTAQYSETIRMTYHRNGLLEIEGSGAVTAPSEGEGRIQFSLPGFEMKDYLTQVTRVQIGEGITALKGSVFGRMDNLEAIDLPESLTYLERHNFYLANGYPKLKSVQIPSGLSRMEGHWMPVNDHYSGNIFTECTGLARLTVDPANPYFTARDGVLYVKDMETLLICPRAKTGYVSIPDGVSSICYDAFTGCTRLTGANIPASVKKIGLNAFYGCSSLTGIAIPEGITEIGDYALCFSNCTSLASISIPVSMTKIGVGTFRGCSALHDVYYSGTAEQWAAVAVGSDNDPLENAVIHYSAAPVPPSPSGNTMGPNSELTWVWNSQTITVTGPVSANQPLWAASFDPSGKLLSVSRIAASGSSARLPAGADSCGLIWLDGNCAPKCENAFLFLT